MALATQCPHCGTMFRVASDQLKLRGGIVRCGACQEIFDGSATLVDLDALPARAPVAPKPAAAPAAPAPAPAAPAAPAATAASVTPAAAPPAEPEPDPLPFTIVDGPPDASDAVNEETAPANFDGQPVYTLDFDHTFDPFGILPKVDAADEAAAAPQEAVPDAPAQAAADLTPREEAAAPAPQAVETQPGEEAVAAAAPVDTEPAAGALPAGPVNADAIAEALADTAPAGAQDADRAQADVAAHAEAAADAKPMPAAVTPAEPVSAEPVSAEPAAEVPVRAEPAPAASAPAAAARAADQKPVPAPVAAAPAPASGRIEPSLDLPVDEELLAQPLPDHDLEPASFAAKASARAADAPPLPMREAAASVINAHAPAVPSAPPVARTSASRRAEKAAARRSRLTPTRIDAPPKIRVPESDEPEFVRRSRQQEQSGRKRKIAMLAGSILLLLLLVAQGAFSFRNALAARFPAAKPALVSSCAVLGCSVELPAQIDKLVIETGELTTLGGGAYAFTTLLRNQGAVTQAWPSLELSLTDADDKPLVRRVFAPRDYLESDSSPGAAPAATGLAPRAEQAIKLHFRVDDLQPSGYHIAVFYP